MFHEHAKLPPRAFDSASLRTPSTENSITMPKRRIPQTWLGLLLPIRPAGDMPGVISSASEKKKGKPTGLLALKYLGRTEAKLVAQLEETG